MIDIISYIKTSTPQIWEDLHYLFGGSCMLVLSRKKNESIVINNDITVTVVEIRGDKVRLGIAAPREVPVRRQEVFDAIQEKAAKELPPERPAS